MRIDTTIPPPDQALRTKSRGRTPKYPFAILPLHGSFIVPHADGERARTAARIWKRRHPGWDYVSRTMEDGYRIWRTS